MEYYFLCCRLFSHFGISLKSRRNSCSRGSFLQCIFLWEHFQKNSQKLGKQPKQTHSKPTSEKAAPKPNAAFVKLWNESCGLYTCLLMTHLMSDHFCHVDHFDSFFTRAGINNGLHLKPKQFLVTTATIGNGELFLKLVNFLV